MPLGQFQGCKKGVFGLSSWEPARRPAESSQPQKKQEDAPKQPQMKAGTALLAKYNYKANPESPLGEAELTVKQGESVVFMAAHPQNNSWWMVQNQEAAEGYLPASYMMVVEEKARGLPWLQNKAAELEKEEVARNEAPPGKYKPYKSAYAAVRKEDPSDEKKWFCDICNKQLNGPKPYQAHMASKNHKEEVQLLEEGY